MPKVNLKPKPDPRIAEVKALLAAGMARKDMSKQALSKKSKVPYSTLNKRFQNPEEMRLGELWKLLDTLETRPDDRARIL